MEELLNEASHFSRLTLEVGTQSKVVEVAEFLGDAVNHGRREHALCFVDCALCQQTVGRGYTTIGQGGKPLQAIGMLSCVDIDINLGALCHFKGIGHLKSMASSHTNTSKQLINVGRTITIADFHGLLKRSV